MESINQFVCERNGIALTLKREDLLHPSIPGNKFRKLYYNLEYAKQLGKPTLVTFGGAFSNHIAAVAQAGREFGFDTVGVIRGEELASKPFNPTLFEASANGMRLHFVSREQFREKEDKSFLSDLEQRFGPFYLLPEGGTNALAVKGCQHILTDADARFDLVCCPVGTGGTMAGLIHAVRDCQKVLGFAALAGNFLRDEILKFAPDGLWEINSDYHFGGYAKVTPELVSFINAFKCDFNIPLDPVYTGKMIFGVMDLIERGYFPKGTQILAVHTGGLQGIAGMNRQLEAKQLPTIET